MTGSPEDSNDALCTDLAAANKLSRDEQVGAVYRINGPRAVRLPTRSGAGRRIHKMMQIDTGTEQSVCAQRLRRQNFFLRRRQTPMENSVGLSRPWAAIASTAVGSSHVRLNPPVPCQDACLASAERRPRIILADGVGSARFSHIGAERLVHMVSCFVDAQQDLLDDLLDVQDPLSAQTRAKAAGFAKSVVRFGASILRHTAQQMAHSVGEFQSTLLLAIVGHRSMFWSQVGDGAILVQDADSIRCLSPRQQSSYSNVVTVVGEAEHLSVIDFGITPSRDLIGIAACSDGAAERLVSNDKSRVAERIGTFMHRMREGSFPRKDLHGFLIDSEIWRSTTGDDKSLGLLAKLG